MVGYPTVIFLLVYLKFCIYFGCWFFSSVCTCKSAGYTQRFVRVDSWIKNEKIVFLFSKKRLPYLLKFKILSRQNQYTLKKYITTKNFTLKFHPVTCVSCFITQNVSNLIKYSIGFSFVLNYFGIFLSFIACNCLLFFVR